MTRTALPSEAQVRTAAENLLTAHRDGGVFPSVTALAKQFDVNRTTFYRHFAAITDAMLDTAGQQHADGPKRRRPPRHDDDRDKTIRRLSDENDNLLHHVEIYEEQLRILTIENKRIREQLEQHAGVTGLSSRRLNRPS
jgi:AcrR family transcriptional regulator